MNSLPITFILKKIISAFLNPLPFTLGIIILGLIFLWLTKKQKTGKILVTAGTALLIFFSSQTGAELLIKPLENHYPVYHPETGKKIRYVVALNGGGIFRLDAPPSIILQPFGTLGRLLEGIRIYRENPGCKLILDGPPIPNTTTSEASILASVAVYFGVNKEDIITVTDVLDTSDEAVIISKIVKNEPFVLVTSATHLRRAMLLFEKNGLRPIPAPSAYLHGEVEGNSVINLPCAGNVFASEQALHEYIGLLWAKLCGKI